MRPIDPLRSAVRSELATAPSRRPSGTRRNAGGRWAAVSLVAALAFGGTGAARADLPTYTNAVLSGLAGLDASHDSMPTFADVDGDGDLDVVVGERDGSVMYFANSGPPGAPACVGVTGTANPFAAIRVALFSAPDLADLDGDGDLDAVVGERFGTLEYWANTGSATNPKYIERLGTANPFDGLDFGNDTAPELADVDGDGDLDAAVGEFQGNLNYLRNTGSATAPAYVVETGAENPFNAIDVGYGSAAALADLDADGDLDAVLGDLAGSLAYFANTGSSTAPAYVLVSGSADPFAGWSAGDDSAPALADVDGDGDFDAVSGDYFGALRYLANTGASTAPAFVERMGSASPFGWTDATIFSLAEMGDLDGDGDLDAVLGDNYGLLRYFANTGSPTAPAYEEATGAGNPFTAIDVGDGSAPALADLDGDGDLDAVLGERYGTILYFANTGSPTVPAYLEITGSASPFTGIDIGTRSTPTLADLDADGDLDLAVGEFLAPLNYFANTGSSTAPAFLERTGTASPFAGIDIIDLAVPELGDLDEDGDLDALIGEGQGFLIYLDNTGSSTAPAFVAATPLTAGPFEGFDSGSSSGPALADVDGDGDLDVVMGQDGGSPIFLRAEAPLFADGFESGDTSAWAVTVP